LSSLSKDTVMKRCKRNNPEALHPDSQSPLHEIEGLLVEWISRLSKMNEPLNRSGVMRLVDDIIRGTIYEEKLKEFNQKRGITEDRKSGLLVGKAWYEDFLNEMAKHLPVNKLSCKTSIDVLGVQHPILKECMNVFTMPWLNVVLQNN
jgi:hypothetical protein